jgi:hypothetical protein
MTTSSWTQVARGMAHRCHHINQQKHNESQSSVGDAVSWTWRAPVTHAQRGMQRWCTNRDSHMWGQNGQRHVVCQDPAMPTPRRTEDMSTLRDTDAQYGHRVCVCVCVCVCGELGHRRATFPLGPTLSSHIPDGTTWSILKKAPLAAWDKRQGKSQVHTKVISPECQEVIRVWEGRLKKGTKSFSKTG